jgi:hypothetical protein
MTERGSERAFGAAADEAGKLVDALGQWLSTLNLSSLNLASVGLPPGLTEHLGAAGECKLCPLCRLIAVLRESRPEVAAHLEDAVASLLAAAAAAADAARSARTPAAGFERIDIG